MLKYDDYKDYINENLTSFFPEIEPYAATIDKAMAYSLKVGGKRLRPVLLLAACDFAGGDIKEALPYACSLEYIHTYSLIHDDLPAMDNDDLRRGQPTNHIVFGEDMAILAGDGLLNTAAETMSRDLSEYYDDPVRMVNHAKAGLAIIESAGVKGMIAGQVADVENQYNEATAELVEFIDANKTGALLTAPVIAGLNIAGADDDMLDNFRSYAKQLGKAFQISDDILDAEGDEKLIGKKVGKDQDAGKCNYVCVHGIDAAKAKLHELTKGAKDALASYGDEASFFIELADKLEIRKA
ncbi:MAG: polyprenyl synthetase family protein [Clostridiales bacterium]|nr:polyprenyl synthetase family protein [Candidatus Crickella merdequi]